MVFIWVHTAITIPHITKITQQFTGTSGYGVYLDASSSKNTTYNQSLTISQEQTMVLLWLHTAITTPHITTRQYNNITGTYDGVYLGAYSDNNTTYNQDYTTIHRNIRLWCLSGCIQQQKYHI